MKPKSLEELKKTALAELIELDDNYIQLQGDWAKTQAGAVKIVSNTWSAILDSRTCELCKSLDGKTLPEGHPDYEAYQPPLHSACRCLFVGHTTESPYKPPINWEPPDPNLVMKHGEFIKPIEVKAARPYSFRKAESIREAEEWANEKFDLSSLIDYKGMSVESVNLINKRMDELFSMFPKMKDKMAFIGSSESFFAKGMLSEIGPRTWAQASRWGDKNIIIFNTQFWRNTKKLRKIAVDLFKEKWFSVGTLESIIDHEFAHCLEFEIQMLPGTWTKFMKHYVNTKEANLVVERISRYADSDDWYEYWAESFAKYKAGKPLSGELAKIMKEIMEAL